MQALLSDKITLLSGLLTGSSTPVPVHAFHYLSTNVAWATSTTTGTIVFEWALDPNYAGTWANISTYAVGSGTPPFVAGDSYVAPGNVFVRARFTVSADVAPTEISITRTA